MNTKSSLAVGTLQLNNTKMGFILINNGQSRYSRLCSCCILTSYVRYVWVIDHFACLWTEKNKHAKKERGQYPAILTERAWSIKNLLYGIEHQSIVYLRDKARIPSGQDHSGQSQREIRFILPPHGARHIIIKTSVK